MNALRELVVTRTAWTLRAPLETAHGRTTRREGVRVELRDDAGRAGVGEAAPLPSHGTESQDACAAALTRLAEARPAGLGPALDAAAAEAGLGPAARWALDTAVGDLEARVAGRSLSAHWARGGATPRAELAVSALLSATAPSAAAVEAERAAKAGHRALKLKVGAAPLADDAARLAAVRDAVGPDVELRLDANGGWSPAEARGALDVLAASGPAFVEQPLAPDDDEAMPALAETSPVRLALDESVLRERDVSRLAARGAAVWVLKPAALGLGRACALEAEASARGVDVVWSSFLDGPVSVGALLHLAAGGAPGPALGLDGLVDPTWPVEGGAVRVPEGPGLGELPG